MTIGTRTDSNGNDPGMNDESTAQIYEACIPSKDTTPTVKERPKLLLEVKTETYCELRIITKNPHQYITSNIEMRNMKHETTRRRKTQRWQYIVEIWRNSRKRRQGQCAQKLWWLMKPLIIELEFEKDTLGPHINIREHIQLRMKKRETNLKNC